VTQAIVRDHLKKAIRIYGGATLTRKAPMLEQANDSYGIANDTRIIKKAVNLTENNKRLFIKDNPSFRRS